MTTDTMKELASLCSQMREAERAVEQAEQELKTREAALRRIAEEDIPGLMSELGLERLVLETGETVSVGLEVYASITEQRKAEAFKWLDDKGFGSLIDTDVIISFSRERRDDAAELFNSLAAQNYEPTSKESVHASRLKSFLKEQLQAGTEVPLELFGARPVKTAKLKAARAR